MTVRVEDAFGVSRDAAMPSLALAVDPASAERAFRGRLDRLTGAGGRLGLRLIRVLRYKPGRRCLIEYEADVEGADGSRELAVFLGKVRVRRYGKSGFRLLDAFWRGGFDAASPDGISVPEPLGSIGPLRMWVQRRAPGRPSSEILAGPGGAAVAARVAEAAHKIHQADIPALRSHTMEDELAILHRVLGEVAAREPKWADRIERVLDACVRLGETVPEPAPRGVHRDFYADQVIVDGTRLSVVDFDLYCGGDPALDVGNFLGHVTEQSLREHGDPSTLGEVERSLEERFAELAGDEALGAARAYAALTLARHIYLSLRFPERRSLTETLIELCEERLHAERERRRKPRL